MKRASRKDVFEGARRGRERTERSRIQMIESELSVASTMYDLAATEFRLGNHAHGLELVRKIREAIESSRKRMDESDAAPQRKNELRRQLEEVESRLQELERQAA